MPGAINFNDVADIKRAGARAGVRQRVGLGRPKAASVLSARWAIGGWER